MKRHVARGKYDRSIDSTKRREQQHAALLEAATEVFGADGFAFTTVESIVARARISRRTFYEHFDDLDDVLKQVHGRLADEAWKQLQALVSMVEDPLERVRVGVAGFFTGVALNPVQARVVFREVRAAGPKFEERWERETTRYVGLLRESLEAAHAAGRLRRRPDEMQVYALVAGLEAVGIRHVMRGTTDRLADEAAVMAELVIAAFDPSEGRKKKRA